jgi:two-component system, cell cycle response regulator DivK
MILPVAVQRCPSCPVVRPFSAAPVERVPPTILLVEDNEDNLALYRFYLEYVGFRVDVARDGLAALDAARNLPDLILLDISIPFLSGFEVAARLKAAEETRRIPIIALTAHVFSSDKSRAATAGFDGFLAKPITPREVAEEVGRLLDWPRSDGGALPQDSLS